MEEIKYSNNKIDYRNQIFDIGEYYSLGDACIINLYDFESNFFVVLVANETSINGIIQTSADMIIETLRNG